MLEFTDKPYEFIPPRLNRTILWISRQIGRFFALRSPLHMVVSVSVENPAVLENLREQAGNRLLFLPNHSTHSDPEVMTEVFRRTGITTLFMAAYDVFLRGRLRGWVMQRTGAFSVDRDGNDKHALKTAMDTLATGTYSLTIFPAGNVHFTNDRVMPFLDGAAFIALKAQQRLGSDEPIFAVPVAIKLTHTTDQSAAIRARMAALAKAAGTTFDPQADIVDEVKRIGLLALRANLDKRGYAPPEFDSDAGIPGLLTKAAMPLIEKLEGELHLHADDSLSSLERIRRIRRTIHQIRIDPEQEAQHAAAAVWADEAILALRILSYAGDYLDRNPTLDRIGESVEKLLEDVTSTRPPAYGKRHAFVRFGEAVDIREYLPEKPRQLRHAIQELTALFEQRVQEALDEINRGNTFPGGRPFARSGSSVEDPSRAYG